MLDEPLDLLLDHLLRRQEHVFEDFDEFRLELRVGDLLPHLHDLDDGLLRPEDPKLDDPVIVLFSRSLRRQLKTTYQVDLATSKVEESEKNLDRSNCGQLEDGTMKCLKP